MLETMLNVAVALALTVWWVIPVVLMTWLLVVIRDHADGEQDRWPYEFDAPFNMDEESA